MSLTRARLLRLTLMLMALALFALFGLRLARNERFVEAFHRLQDLNPLWMAAVAGLYLFVRFLNSELMRLVLLRLGHRLGARETFAVMMAKTYTNLLVSKGGAGTAAAYLKLRHGVQLADVGSMFLAVTVLQFVCIGALGLSGQAVLHLTGAAALDPFIALLFAVVGGGSAVLVFVRLPVPRFVPRRLAEFAHRANDGWARLGRSHDLLPRLLAIQVLVLVLRAVRLWLLFHGLGYTVRPLGLLLASMLGDLGLLVAITPMGLGFREAAVGWGASLAGLDPRAAVAVTLVDRVIWSVAAAVAAQWAIWWALRTPRPGPTPAPQPPAAPAP